MIILRIHRPDMQEQIDLGRSQRLDRHGPTATRRERADRLSLTVAGPFGAGLAAEPDNLILRALRRLGQVTYGGEPPLKVTLDKRLPIAAGLGGGSSDAGAALTRRSAPLPCPQPRL